LHEAGFIAFTASSQDAFEAVDRLGRSPHRLHCPFCLVLSHSARVIAAVEEVMRNAILANVANIVAANGLDVVAVVRNASTHSSMPGTRLFGLGGGTSTASSQGSWPCASPRPYTAAPGKHAEHQRAFAACRVDRLKRDSMAGNGRSQRLCTSLLAATASRRAG
jgi:hypothetical protein